MLKGLVALLLGHVMVYGGAETCPLSLAGAATSIIFVATKVLSRVGRDNRRVLSRQKYTCRAKVMFVATKLLSQ